MAESGLLVGSLAEALHGDMVPKFLATLDAAGKPNVVPIISLDAADDRTLFFGQFLAVKTRENLGADPRICAAVITEDLSIWTIRGRFREWAEGGPLVERINQKELYRYNAYMKISRVAVIDAEAVTGAWKLSLLGVALEALPVRLRGMLDTSRSERVLPPRVAEKFARTKAVKLIAYRGADGYPEIVPAFSLVPTRSDRMVFGARLFGDRVRRIPRGATVAASVITFDPVAYQVKGTFEGLSPWPMGGIAGLRVREVYSASPPLPGEPIEMPPRGSL